MATSKRHLGLWMGYWRQAVYFPLFSILVEKFGPTFLLQWGEAVCNAYINWNWPPYAAIRSLTDNQTCHVITTNAVSNKQQRCSLGRIIEGGGATIVREQKEDQAPCCEQLNFRIIGEANAPPAPPPASYGPGLTSASRENDRNINSICVCVCMYVWKMSTGR